MRPLVITTIATLVAANTACGGRTELLREQRQLVDAGDGRTPTDAGQPAQDAGQPNRDAGCDQTLALEPLVVSLPNEPFSFRAWVDGAFFWKQEGDRITRTLIGTTRPDFTIVGPARLLDVRGGQVLFNGIDGDDGRNKATLFRSTGFSFFDSPASLGNQFGFTPDFQYISSSRVAWLDPSGAILYDSVSDNAALLASGATALAVGEPLTAWNRFAGTVFIEDSRRGGRDYPLPSRGVVEHLAVGLDEVAGLAEGSPFIWHAEASDPPIRPEGVPSNDCAFVVASDWGAVFVCSEDMGRTTFAYAVDGAQTTVIPTGRSVVVAVSMFEEFFSYIAFPAGEDFCQGGAEGRVRLYDLKEDQTYDLGTVTSPCGCCGRISAFPRTHVRDNVVLWHGESNAEGSFGFEFAAVRIERRCE